MLQVNVALEDTENNSVLADKCGHRVAVSLQRKLPSRKLSGSSMILLLHVLLLCMGREDTGTATSRFLPKGDKGC